MEIQQTLQKTQLDRTTNYVDKLGSITGREFVDCLGLQLTPFDRKIKTKVRGTYRLGAAYGYYKIVTDMLRYCIYKCVQEKTKIKFKGGYLEFGQFSKFKQLRIRSYKKIKYKNFDYNNPDLKIGGVQIKSNTPAFDRKFNFKTERNILEGEIKINGELQKQIVEVINTGVEYWKDQKVITCLDVIKQIHWYFPMYSELELEHILQRVLGTMLKFSKRDIPYDLTWRRKTKDIPVFMIRSFHTTNEKEKFMDNRKIFAAIIREETLRENKKRELEETFIRDRRKQHKINKKRTLQDTSVWNELFKKDLIERIKTTEEVLQLYTQNSTKETLASLLQKNTKQDLRHYLLDLL